MKELIDKVIQEARKVASPKERPGFEYLPPFVRGMLIGYTSLLKEALEELDKHSTKGEEHVK